MRTTTPSLARAASMMRGLLRRRPRAAWPDPADLGTAFGLEATLEAMLDDDQAATEHAKTAGSRLRRRGDPLRPDFAPTVTPPLA